MTARRKSLVVFLAAVIAVSGTTLSAWALLGRSSASTVPKDLEPRTASTVSNDLEPGSAPELRTVLDQVVDGGVPGVIAQVQEGRDARAVAAGVDDLTTGARLRPTAKLRVGSITKTFVATVVLQLVEERRLRLDAPVDTWLPGLLPDGGAITIRHLLQHTSGLADYVETPGFTEGLLENPIYEPEELVALGGDRRPTRVPARDRLCLLQHRLRRRRLARGGRHRQQPGPGVAQSDLRAARPGAHLVPRLRAEARRVSRPWLCSG